MDKISLRIPNQAIYLSPLRLLVSGLLTSHKVDIETMEDVKIAVTECCNIALELNCEEYIDIDFIFVDDDLYIEISAFDEKIIKEREDLSLAETIIECLVDSCVLEGKKLCLEKNLK